MNEHTPCQAPKVSVLVPIYKTQEAHLRQMIESVLNQTFQEFELILLNDSPDDLRLQKIAEQYADARIRYVCDGKNVGISAARNRLIELATAPYLAILDHDDIMMPERLKQQVEYLDTHPEVGVVGCRMLEIPRNRVICYPENDAEIRLVLMNDCAIPHTGSIIRKSVLIDHGIHYEEEFSPAEDYALWLRLLAHTKFYNIPQVLMQYRMHASNTTHTEAAQMRHQSSKLYELAHKTYPSLYAHSLELTKSVTNIRLFAILPLLRMVKQGNRTTIYLFECLPFCTIKTKKKAPSVLRKKQ